MLAELEGQIEMEDRAAAGVPDGLGLPSADADQPMPAADADLAPLIEVELDPLELDAASSSASSSSSSSSESDSSASERERELTKELLHKKLPAFAQRVGEVMATAHPKGAAGFAPKTRKYMALATELFLKQLGEAAMKQAHRDSKKEADYAHVAALARRPQHLFLSPMFPATDGQRTLI
eukprot:TRINITY_DN6529_c0_g6_i1.p2 TRINITY_DN6529_c0_g6~~TRINITY_DN6529_c0_g6_i1.p2  ORF type:complete len:180 (+),score=53.64 TRINITY_DN6529_c0_g6_i1:185-724(+)